MFRKILIGMFVFFAACTIAAAGYQFGQYMAERHQGGKASESLPGTRGG